MTMFPQARADGEGGYLAREPQAGAKDAGIRDYEGCATTRDTPAAEIRRCELSVARRGTVNARLYRKQTRCCSLVLVSAGDHPSYPPVELRCRMHAGLLGLLAPAACQAPCHSVLEYRQFCGQPPPGTHNSSALSAGPRRGGWLRARR